MVGMSFRRKVFVSEKIAFYISGRELQVQALVSIHGAKYVFEESEIPPQILEALGSEVEARYRGLAVRCRVVRETNAAGTIFSFRFLNASTLLLQQIGKDIRERGIPSPWLRSLPRLVPEAARHLPSPSLAMVSHQGGMVFLTVKNFTVGGLLLECEGDELGGIAMGSVLHFDLVTNAGEKLTDFQAMVCHVCAEKGDGAAKTLFGVRFLFMTGLGESKYKALVREHCLGLRSDLDGRIDD
jgi:hypothetical protein